MNAVADEEYTSNDIICECCSDLGENYPEYVWAQQLKSIYTKWAMQTYVWVPQPKNVIPREQAPQSMAGPGYCSNNNK